MMNLPNEINLNGKHERVESKSKAPKIILIILGALLAVLIILLITFLIIRARGRKSLLGEKHNVTAPSEIVDSSTEDGSKVVYKGENYTFNKDVTGILVMGVDKENISDDNGYGTNGQADSIFVAAVDTKKGTIKIIPISRETMVDVNMYSNDGAYVGVQKSQVCLAYSYGTSGATSCENVRKSIARLLYGLNCNSYIAIDLKGVKTLTDRIGGVDVTALETLKNEQHQIFAQEGKPIHLTGELARLYIRMRGNDLDANNRRMQRQKQFLTSFISKAGNQLMSNITRLGSYYNAIKPYIVSDLSFSEITFLSSCCLTNNLGRSIEYLNIEGKTVMGESHAEFYPDETSVYESILSAFYSKEE